MAGSRLWQTVAVLSAVLGATACATSNQSTTDAPAERMLAVAPFENADVAIDVRAVLADGHEQTLVKDEGWVEFVIALANPGSATITVRDVKLLDTDGRYQNSASSYAEITAPPHLGAEVAGTVARTGSGLVLGSFIPFGGALSSLFWGVTSAFGAEGRGNAQRAFRMRVLKNVEFAPGGSTSGSAFLPNISNAMALVVDYSADGRDERIELPFLDPPPKDATNDRPQRGE